jgi:hypothetical protein
MCFTILMPVLLDYTTVMKCMCGNTLHCNWCVMLFTVQWYWSEGYRKYVGKCRNTTYLLWPSPNVQSHVEELQGWVMVTCTLWVMGWGGVGGGGLPSFNSQLFKALLHPLEGLLKNIPRVYGLQVNCSLKFLANMITYYLLSSKVL